MGETAYLGYNAAMGLGLAEEMRRDPSVFVLGQGMVNGGWFGTERGLVNEFGTQRVLDTNISEAFQAGLTVGAAIVGMKPVINMGFGDFALIAGDEIFHKLAMWRYMHGLEMAMTAPANKLSIVLHPSTRPAMNPSHIIKLAWSNAVSPAVGPSRTSFPRLKSSPSENIRRITPSSDSVWTTSRSANSGRGTFGPTMNPARMYPSTTGCRSRWNTTVVTAATPSTVASAARKAWASMGRSS